MLAMSKRCGGATMQRSAPSHEGSSFRMKPERRRVVYSNTLLAVGDETVSIETPQVEKRKKMAMFVIDVHGFETSNIGQ